LISGFSRVLNVVYFLLGISLTEGSETSAALKLTPGKYPKEDIQQLATQLSNINGKIFIHISGIHNYTVY
jgi:hypothetical protein